MERLGEIVIGAEPQPADRSPGSPAAVSMSTITRLSREVIIWHSVSPWIPGRSRSSTTTS
jgi:hypothetical protein